MIFKHLNNVPKTKEKTKTMPFIRHMIKINLAAGQPDKSTPTTTMTETTPQLK